MTPTNSCLGYLDPARIAKLDLEGNRLSGDAPTKETALHLAFYAARSKAGGVVHLHSTYATALSCLDETNPEDAVPMLTPYVAMRVGTVPVLPYTPPGSDAITPHIMRAAPGHAAVLLANHGPVVSGGTFRDAVFAAEELEDAAKLAFVTSGRAVRRLPTEEVARLRQKWS